MGGWIPLVDAIFHSNHSPPLRINGPHHVKFPHGKPLLNMKIHCFSLRGHDPSLTLISQKNPYTIGPFSISSWSVEWILTRSSMKGCWKQVSAPRDGCDVIWFPLSLPSHRFLCFRDCKTNPLFQPSIPPWKYTIDLRSALTCCSGTFTLLEQLVVQISQLT